MACVIAVAQGALLSESQNQFLFSKYITNFNKTYEVVDMFRKYAVFKENIDMILNHNLSDDSTYKMGVNQFTDMTSEEFAAYVNLNNAREKAREIDETEPIPQEEFLESIDIGLPDIDWVAKFPNYPVKDQGTCSASGIFATTYTYSFYLFKELVYPIMLSEQQLVDCMGFGCGNPLPISAFTYISHHNGICPGNSYPFHGVEGSCKTDCGPKIYKYFSLFTVTGSEAALAGAIKNGPVAVVIDATPSCFQHYSSGVLTNCPGTNDTLNHFVVAVGLGQSEGVEFFKIRNSWGTSWGEAGYARIQYGVDTVSIGRGLRINFGIYPKINIGVEPKTSDL